MLQQEKPDDYVVATGRTVSIREFCDLAFGHAGLIADEHVRVSQALIRPAEVDVLQGDASKARALSAGSRKSRSRRWSRKWSRRNLVRHRSRMAA